MRKIGEISAEKMRVKEELNSILASDNRNIDLVRQKVREQIVTNQQVDLDDKLLALLKQEYELEREENEVNFKLQLIDAGKKSNTPEFERALEELMIQSDIKSLGFTEEQINGYHKVIQVKVILGDEIPQTDILGTLLSKQIILEREKLRSDIEKALSKNFDKNSPGFQNTLNARMIMEDRAILDAHELAQRENEFNEKKRNNEEIDLTNGYYRFLQKEQELYDRIAEAKLKKEAEALNNAQNEPEVAAEEPEVVAEDPNAVVNEAAEPKPSGNRFTRFFSNLFKRKPKQEPVVAEPVKTEVKEEPVNTEVKEETVKEETKEKEAEKEIEEEIKKQQELEAQNKLLEEEREKEEKKKREEEQAHKYRVEFAGKELPPAIRNCGDPTVLSEYLKEATNLKPETREHLEARALANAKIQSLEESRAIIQKNRPPAIKYKDGTILLMNKKKDVPKQTTINGCWSAVLSDMLGHFGVDLTQEEIRAYRPELQSVLNNKEADKINKIHEESSLMDRLNSDSMNEINDMADLIQRTVPNVAHHHMSLAPNRKENKAVLKETVADALLNKNSPVALLYGDHYVSIVGIKGDTLIVQNPSAAFDTKYQRLSIDDLFDRCNSANGMGQVTIDWLEDLKFNKDGTCKNMNEQWKGMGIDCNGREFGKGHGNNYDSHVRGYEFDDDSRIMNGIEETIYLPKMSFGREKDMMKATIKEQQIQSLNKETTTIQNNQHYVHKQIEDETEIAKDENELTLDELNGSML